MKNKRCARIFALLLCAAMVLGMMPMPVFATETPDWVADYTVTASCGTGGTALGMFNGSSACVDGQTGELHYCSANFPYLEMQIAVYTGFTGDFSATPDNVKLAINGNVFMDLEEARNIKNIDVHAHTRSKNETPTVQGVQYFTELTYFVYDGHGMYDGRYDGDDTIQSIDLSKNTKLKELHLCYFSMEGIDLSANTNLEHILLEHSSSSASSRESAFKGLARLKSLDLSNMENLEELYLYDQDLETLDFSNNTKLNTFVCHLMSKLQSVEMSGNEAITDLRITRSSLTELDVGEKPELKQAYIHTNTNLKSIDLSGCSALTSLQLSENALESVDLTNNTELKTLQINANKLTELDLSKNTKLQSLNCQNNHLTSIDLSQNTALSTYNSYLNSQTYNIGDIVDDVYDLNDLPEGFDASKIVKQTNSGTEYQFQCRQDGYYTYTYESVGEDLLLSLKEKNDVATYTYYTGRTSNNKDLTMQVTLEAEDKYYTVKCGTPDMQLRTYTYSGGAGEPVTEMTVRRGNSLRFVVEALPGSPLYGKKLAVFSQAAGANVVPVDDYTNGGDVYYSISSVYGPTVITVAEGHDCVFSDWTPVENTSKHERHCTVEGCTVEETGWCSDYYGEEYHADLTTMQKDCSLCGRANTWQIEASGSAHVDAVTGSCNAPGNVEFWICGHCNKYFADENCKQELTPAEAFSDPVAHKYANGVCTVCGDKVITARFEEALDDTYSSEDEYWYVLAGKTEDGKVYVMGEATADGKRQAIEVPAAQIDKNGLLTLSSDKAEFMDFEYYFENGSGASSDSSFLVDGNYMSVRDGMIYVYPASRLDDPINARPFTFRQANYWDESGLGSIYGNVYDKKTYKHTYEYITFNAETLCFEACDTEQETIYLYRQVCEHEDADVAHTTTVEPTCTEQGYGGEYWFCGKCQTYFSDADCTTEYEFPEDAYDLAEYFTIPALGHKYDSEGVCEYCGRTRPVYTQVSSLEAFDQLSEDASYLFVFKDGDKAYAARLPELEYPCDIDSDGDGIVDAMEADDNANEIPDCIEKYIDENWGGYDLDEDGTTSAEEYKEAISDYTEGNEEDNVVDIEDYKCFFNDYVYWDLSWRYEEEAMATSNFVEVPMAADGSITLTDEDAMELSMVKSGVWGGQTEDGTDVSEYGVTENDRLRAAWVPNYWVANDGLLGGYDEGHFMIQRRWFGDDGAPGIIDNKNWKISFNEDGTALLVSTWSSFDDTAALQLVKYTNYDDEADMTIVGLYEDRWEYSDIMCNRTEQLPAYLYASEVTYATPPHECVWGPWEKDATTDTHTRVCTVEDCDKKQTEKHNWDDGVKTEEPTCAEPGEVLYTCPDCKATKTDIIPVLEHDWTDWTYESVDSHVRSCKRECGVEQEFEGHEWGEWRTADENTHEMVCSVCGGKQTEEHDWDEGVVTKEPTEWEVGIRTYTCGTCELTKLESIDKLVHECVFTDWYADGDENHKRDCMDDHCDNFETLPHEWDDGVATEEPTCTEKGVKTFTCQTCMHTRTEEIPELGHKFGDWTADEYGRTHIRECACGETESQPHNWSEWKEQATGEYVRNCDVCRASEEMILDEEKPVNTTDKESNAANTNLADSDMELIDRILTEEEQSQAAEGAEVKVYLKVEDISNEVPATHTAEVAAKAGDDEIAMYLDIDLFKQIGDAQETQVSETDGTVTITIIIPDELINTDETVTRTYKIVRVHEDENGNLTTDIIEGVFNPEDNSFTFQSDKFSTYALLYTDTDSYIKGDLDGNGSVDDEDVIYLLWHTLMSDEYPVNQPVDFDHNGSVDDEDVIYLLWHTLMSDEYPL